MIIGADASTDRTILAASSRLYAEHRLRRVYYSAFSPIPHASPALPALAAPMLREHRLYQADWLMRFYGFAQGEILDAGANDMLDLRIDPKLAWALRHRDRFPVDVNKADRSQLLRVPGLGKRTVDRLLTIRRHRSVGLEDLRRLRVAIKTVRPFVVTADRRGAAPGLDGLDLRARLAPKARQLDLFAENA